MLLQFFYFKTNLMKPTNLLRNLTLPLVFLVAVAAHASEAQEPNREEWDNTFSLVARDPAGSRATREKVLSHSSRLGSCASLAWAATATRKTRGRVRLRSRFVGFMRLVLK